MFKTLLFGTKADTAKAERVRLEFFDFASERLLEEATRPNGKGEAWYEKMEERLRQECNKPQLARTWLKLGHFGPAYNDFLWNDRIFQKESYWDIQAEQEKVEQENEFLAHVEKFGLDQSRLESIVKFAHETWEAERQMGDNPAYFGRRDALLAVSKLRYNDAKSTSSLKKLVNIIVSKLEGVERFHSQLKEIKEKGLEGSPEAHEMIIKRFRYIGKGSYHSAGNSDMCFDSDTSYSYDAIHYKEYLFVPYEDAVKFVEEYLQAGKQAIEELLAH